MEATCGLRWIIGPDDDQTDETEETEETEEIDQIRADDR